MPWSASNLPPSAKNLTGSAVSRFVAAANSALENDPDDEAAAIRIGMSAAKDDGDDDKMDDNKKERGDSRAFRVDRIGVVMVTDREDLPTGVLRARIDETTGFLHVRDSKIARSGTLRYSDGEREWMEYRSDSTIERAADSFGGVVFTKDHPPVLVTADNVSRYQAGHVGSVRKDGAFLVADEIVITRRDAIERAQQPGGWELSIGFLTDVVRQDGESPQGDAYQYIQTNLEGNHLAGVDEGRAGPECRLAMDSAYSVTAISDGNATGTELATAKENTMEKETQAAEVPETKADSAEQVRDDAPAKVEKVDHAKLVRERVNLVRHAEAILGEAKFDENADDETLMLAVIAKVDGEDVMRKVAEMAAEGQRASFDAAVRAHKKAQRVDTAAQIAGITSAVHFDGAAKQGEEIDLASELASLNQYYKDAHRSPVGKGIE